ncbi:MAG: HDOD domain-containing protein [Massilia sp.]
MINWLTRWFKGAQAEPGAAAAASSSTAVAEPVTTATPAASPEPDTLIPIDLPLLFFRTLAGASVTEVPAATAQLILDELARLVAAPQAGADLVPRVPAVIPQLLRSLRDDAVTGADLSRQLAQDVVLVAEVIREANSSYYSPPAPVRTIEGAVMLLGQNGMRMLLARVAFRPIISLQTGRFAHHGAPLVWRESEACALAASLLAPGVGANVFEAYLAGLLHHVGLIVALRLIDRVYSGAALPATPEFAATLLREARTLSARIAALWEFPPAVCQAIEEAGTAAPASPLAQVLAGAERLALLRLLVDGGQFEAAATALAPDETRVFEQLRVTEAVS